TIMMQRG
nr:Chain P, p2/NC substrate peptide [Human immunodeficiency virus 1]4FAE_D Chain D, Substrate p2/NC peptide [Human immunodeficiency virus 1]